MSSVTYLRTQDGVHYLTAELDGSVNATRTESELGACGLHLGLARDLGGGAVEDRLGLIETARGHRRAHEARIGAGVLRLLLEDRREGLGRVHHAGC